MLINFCIGGLTEDISCDSICFEGHEVKKLVLGHRGQKSVGFLADYFVKPPVIVKLKFICQINISQVVIKTSVGAQKSVSFELNTKTSKGSYKIATAYDKAFDFLKFHIYGKSDLPESSNLNNYLGIPFDQPIGLKNVRELHIKITKTVGSSVPALGNLEVWGSPATPVSDDLNSFILKKWNEFNSSNIIDHTVIKSEFPRDSQPPHYIHQKKLRDTLRKEVNIPEEFIDPITCDIMLIPMVLPSGKTVDQSTLERFYKVESEWHRGESDPFTGVSFSSDKKPIMDQILKARIDKFLVANCEVQDVKNMGRILGRNPDLSVPGTSKDPSNTGTCIKVELKRGSENTRPDISSQFKKQCFKSLDQLIESSLCGFPSFLESPVIPAPVSKNCSKCQSESLIFKLPCSHLVCRPCLIVLTSEKSILCSVCKNPFLSSEPVRQHDTT